jgi:hypothetical protein
MGAEALCERARCPPDVFGHLLPWLESEGLVRVDKSEFRTVSITWRGEVFLLSLLEQTCELPDLQ